MTTIALFHSVLGVRPGLAAAADGLRAHGHDVVVVDQYGGLVFEDYEPAMAHADELGFPALMNMAANATADLPEGFVPMGFSNGAGMAEYVATVRPDVGGVVMFGGALDPKYLGVPWPSAVPGQIHFTTDDPWVERSQIAAVVSAGAAVDAEIQVFEYPGSGHLFADSSKVDEYQPAEAELMWSRVLAFLAAVG